jgi:hypothetical protein
MTPEERNQAMIATNVALSARRDTLDKQQEPPGLSDGAIIGIVMGVITVIAVAVGLAVLGFYKKLPGQKQT